MKRFHFRLESVLRLRSHAEEKERRRLAEANAVCNSIEQHIQILQTERNQAFAADGGDDMSYQQFRALYIGRIEDRARQLQAELQEAMAKREEVAETYRAVRRDYEAVARLKERAMDSYKKQWFQEEAKEIDDIANSRLAGGAHG